MPDKLNHPMKGLIDIQNDDNKCFAWCHVRHLNSVAKNPQDREVFKKLNYQGIDFPVSKKDYGKVYVLNGINVYVFRCKDKMIYPVYLSDQKFDDYLDLLLISNNFTSHYVYIKDFNRLIFNKTKHERKKYFCKSCLQCFSSEKVLKDHKEDCLMINGKQNVKLEKGFISFRNFNRQISVPFKIYTDFECLLKGCDVGMLDVVNVFLIPKNIKTTFIVVLLIKLFVLIINLVKMLCCTEEKIQFLNL